MDKKKQQIKGEDQLVWRTLVFILSFFLLAFVFTDSFWGVHFFALVPVNVKALTLVLVIAILFIGNNEKAIDLFRNFKFQSWGKAAIITVLFGILFHNLNFVNDAYGDALRHKQFLPDVVEELNHERTFKAFTLNVFQSKIGEITVLNSVELISYHTGANVIDVFRWIGTVFGMIFVFFWILFTGRYFSKKGVANVVLILGLFSPFLQLFFGHIEIYAPAITATALTLMSLLLFLKEQEKKWGFIMLLCLLLSMKFHFVSVLMIPACLIAWGSFLSKKDLSDLVTWRRMWLLVMVPVFIAGIIAYIFVFKDHTDPRFLDGTVDTSERLFLPFFSPEPPLDRYNLFSWSHIWDFMNILFLWSTAGIFILVIAVIKRKQIEWKHEGLVLITMTLLLYAGLFFMVNPLLSMPMDWDLFSLPAPVFLIFAALLYEQLTSEKLARRLIAPVLMLSMLTIPVIATNASTDATSKRLEYIGRYTFKNYWIRSIETLKTGLNMRTENYENRLLSNVKKLKPYAVKGKDLEYANLLWRTGQFYRKNGKIQESLKWHLESRAYYSGLDYNRIGIMESYYLLERYDEALSESMGLIEVEYPSKERALKIALDCAIKANDTLAVISLGEQLQVIYPQDSYFSNTVKAFQSNQKVGASE